MERIESFEDLKNHRHIRYSLDGGETWHFGKLFWSYPEQHEYNADVKPGGVHRTRMIKKKDFSNQDFIIGVPNAKELEGIVFSYSNIPEWPIKRAY